MKTWIVVLLVFGSLGMGCGKKPAAGSSLNTNASTEGNPLTAPVDYIGAVGKAQRLAEKTTAMISIEKGVQAFYAGEDRYPHNLRELVTSQYLPALPAPPRGMQYVYNPNTGQVSLSQVPPSAAPAQPAR